MTASLLSDLLASVEAILQAPDDTHTARDLSLYSGAAGIGLELLQHLEQRIVRDRVRDLAEFTARAASHASLPPGLFTGATGVHMFLQEARNQEIEGADDCPYAAVPRPEWTPDGHDLIAGAAGVGLGHLAFYRAAGDPAHLDISSQCARALIDPATGETRFAVSPATVNAVEPSLGCAHGLAGATFSCSASPRIQVIPRLSRQRPSRPAALPSPRKP